MDLPGRSGRSVGNLSMAPNGFPNSHHRLFVYGTLAPGRSNHHIVEHLEGTWEEAEVNGILYPHGIGPTAGYPALELDAQGPSVPGYLLTSAELPAHWPAIDAFEGAGYRRVTTTVRRSDGTPIDACLYVLGSGLHISQKMKLVQKK